MCQVLLWMLSMELEVRWGRGFLLRGSVSKTFPSSSPPCFSRLLLSNYGATCLGQGTAHPCLLMCIGLLLSLSVVSSCLRPHQSLLQIRSSNFWRQTRPLPLLKPNLCPSAPSLTDWRLQWPLSSGPFAGDCLLSE